MLPLVAPYPPWQHCGISGNYTAGSKYQANLQLISTTLPSNASSSPALFAKATAGAEPDQVFALALCRGDTNASSCLDCTTRAFGDAQSLCPYSKEAAVYDDLCLAFFSGDNFLASMANLGQIRHYVTRNSPTNTTGPGFVTLVSALLTYTMQFAVYNSTVIRWYSTVRMDVVTPPLFSLMQCTPDMLGTDCWQCLLDLVGNSTFNGSTAGVRNLGARCGYRGSIYLSLRCHFTTGKKMTSKLLIVALLLPLIATAFVLVLSFVWIRSLRNNKLKLRKKDTATREEVLKLWRIEESNSDFMLFDFTQIKEATSNFSEEKKLGEGGFGSVYKGQLRNGIEVAVKRLAAHSRQGLVEFKNEIQLIAKLQHTNLVNLRGCCIEGEENILIYEYMPNKSLDFFIFDEKRASLLNWNRRLYIIEGISQGLLYLHRHSRLRIIHRDLKASNILLDNNMNPKISDFGLARIFDSTDIQVNTKRVVGTYGYMAPEYASEGCFSVKSDVFSYGVLLLEIISGKRNSGFHQCGDFFNLLGYAWQLWKDETWLDLVAPPLVCEGKMMEIKKCIKIALLCVQENAADRPTMSDVVIMLSSELLALPEPKQPAFFNVRATHGELSTTRSSVNDLTITIVDGR
ncbi:Cysteine-rich receptor-like protein kinase 8 [Dichanthelium oligosanthes]|uniref:non-specific serine/threonine protein kinase n=1 Tax=Dichanthelium oligosanthes TaxID=888268 RepID=A0A1E5V4P6_9POAL|nr:Cysteine-rich receptor-like protein kinase 8 [Dichanthelium oligosanthes]